MVAATNGFTKSTIVNGDEIRKKVRLSFLLPFFLYLPIPILVVPLLLKRHKGEGVAFEDCVDSGERRNNDHRM